MESNKNNIPPKKEREKEKVEVPQVLPEVELLEEDIDSIDTNIDTDNIDLTIELSDLETLQKYTHLLCEGQYYKNYRELCSHLQEEPTTGKSKQLQLKEWERFFSWERRGNGYLIKEIYTLPHQKIDKRSNKSLGGYSSIVNTIMLYMLMYGKREDSPYGYSFTKSQLRKDILKLVNKDYYDIRKEGKRAGQELGVDPRVLYFLDNQISERMRKMSDRGIRVLEDEGVVSRSIKRFVQYIDLEEYRVTGEKKIRTKEIKETDSERLSKVLGLGYCGDRWERSERYFKILNQGDSFFEEKEFEVKTGNELKKELWIANGGLTLEEAAAGTTNIKRENIKKFQKDFDEWYQEVRDNMRRDGIEEITPQEELFVQMSMLWKRMEEEEPGKYVIWGKDEERTSYYTELGIERLLGESGVFGCALEWGEFWTNIFEKTLIITPTPTILSLIVLEKKIAKEGPMITMPEAQLRLNKMTKKWIESKMGEEGSWVDFKNKFRIQSGTGSKDLKRDAEEFIERYIDIENVEPQYRWRTYVDERGKSWKVRYSSNIMSFNGDNLNGWLFAGTEQETEPEVVLWNTPQKGMLCTNCRELMDLAREEWSRRGWMPIEGYLGGIWDEGEGKEIGCVILNLGDEGSEFLKEAWENRAGAK